MTLRAIYRDGSGLRVQSHDDANTLVQVPVGEPDCVADEELFAFCARRRRRLGMDNRGSTGGNDRRVGNRPMSATATVLNNCLRVPKLDDGALRQGSQWIVAHIVNAHPEVQPLPHFQNPSGVVKHFADREVEAIKLGAGRLSKCIENVHESKGVFSITAGTYSIYPTGPRWW